MAPSAHKVVVQLTHRRIQHLVSGRLAAAARHRFIVAANVADELITWTDLVPLFGNDIQQSGIHHYVLSRSLFDLRVGHHLRSFLLRLSCTWQHFAY